MDERSRHYQRLLDFYRECGEINEETYRNALTWLTDPEYADFHDQLLEVLRPTPLIDAFYQFIPFGTGGRRGTVGVGSNRMNARTVGESAQGLAVYIKSQDPDGSAARRGVVVACDVRLSSAEFTKITAEVLAGNGVKVWLFDGPRSTPLLSFAVRYLKTQAGAVITASHNPPSDNGFKAYWEDGGQVVAPHDRGIMEEVGKVRKINRMPLEEAKIKGLVEVLDDRVDRAYLEKVEKDLAFCAERNACIVYSPLHGTGLTIVPPAFKVLGFENVHLPQNQIAMDGSFPSVPKNYPNPEVPAAMTEAVRLGQQVRADIVLASDPDADRLGVFVPSGNDQFVYLTGNVFQAMMLYFVLSRRKEQKRIPPNAYVLTTQVTTKLIRRICESFGVEVTDDLLVGFKNIAAEMRTREQKGQPASSLMFSCEESIGYMLLPEVRDKDSAAAAVTAGQMAAWCKARGLTLLQYLDQLYAQYGYFKEAQFSVFLEGEAGADRMKRLMDELRTHPPAHIAGLPVLAITDRQADTRRDVKSAAVQTLDKPKSNVLAYSLADGDLTSVTIRPSGTEPKIKHYIAHYGPNTNRAAVDQMAAKLEAEVKRIEQEILNKLK